MNFATFVHKWGRATPDAPAVAAGHQVVLDYRALSDRVARMAGGLQHLGLARGDRVGLLMRNTSEYFECMLACWHAGLAAVPINAKLHPREVSFILSDSGASACFVSPGLQAEQADNLTFIEVGSAQYAQLAQAEPVPIADTQPSDLAWLFYTSGTTGQPKGCILPNEYFLTWLPTGRTPCSLRHQQ
jgi:long-chain acyl-CoA synthetase